MKISFSIAVLIGVISSQEGETFEIPLTFCETESDCNNEPNGNDFCCTQLTVFNIIEEESFEKQWGLIKDGYGVPPGVTVFDNLYKGNSYKICTSIAYNV